MRRREFIAALGGAAVAWPHAARAQPAPKTHFVLWVSTEAQPDPFIAGFREGMREPAMSRGKTSPLFSATRQAIRRACGRPFLKF